MKSPRIGLALLAVLTVTGAPLATYAQATTTTPQTEAPAPVTDDDDDGFDLGWLGLLGLLGLAGLRRRNDHVRTTTTR